MKRLASGYAKGSMRTFSMTLKIAVDEPMPSASVAMATAAKPGFLRSPRNAYVKSRHSVSRDVRIRTSRVRSFRLVTLPSWRCAAYRASAASIPAPRFLSVRWARWKAISSSRSRLSRSGRDVARRRCKILPSHPVAIDFSSFPPCRLCKFREFCLRRLQYASDRARHASPVLGLLHELFLAGVRQSVKFRAAIVVRDAPLGRKQAAQFEAVQCGVKRAFFNA